VGGVGGIFIYFIFVQGKGEIFLSPVSLINEILDGVGFVVDVIPPVSRGESLFLFFSKKYYKENHRSIDPEPTLRCDGHADIV
jgi:hypothetical protein